MRSGHPPEQPERRIGIRHSKSARVVCSAREFQLFPAPISRVPLAWWPSRAEGSHRIANEDTSLWSDRLLPGTAELPRNLQQSSFSCPGFDFGPAPLWLLPRPVPRSWQFSPPRPCPTVPPLTPSRSRVSCAIGSFFESLNFSSLLRKFSLVCIGYRPLQAGQHTGGSDPRSRWRHYVYVNRYERRSRMSLWVGNRSQLRRFLATDKRLRPGRQPGPAQRGPLSPWRTEGTKTPGTTFVLRLTN